MTRRRLPDEFDLIATYFAPLAMGNAGALGLRDDAALLDCAPGYRPVVTMDTLVGGVHFLADDSPDLIARKLLRVNLSDLAAMGADARVYFMAISLTADVDTAWIEAFAAGLAADQAELGVRLAGGDITMTPGPVTLTLYAGASRLELPVRPPREEVAPSFEEPEGAPPMACDQLEPETCSRTITRDIGSGAVTLRTVDDDGLKRIKAHGLEVGSRAVESFTITPEDPLSARAEAAWTFRIGRGGWRTRTEGRTVMWSDRDNFYLEAKLEAFEGDARVFEKTWNETIPRDLV